MSDKRIAHLSKRIAKLSPPQRAEFERLVGKHAEWCDRYGIEWNAKAVAEWLGDAEKGRLKK